MRNDKIIFCKSLLAQATLAVEEVTTLRVIQSPNITGGPSMSVALGVGHFLIQQQEGGRTVRGSQFFEDLLEGGEKIVHSF